MENLTRYTLGRSKEYDCNCSMVEWSEGVWVKFSEVEKILTAHNTQRLSFLRKLWNWIIGKNDSHL